MTDDEREALIIEVNALMSEHFTEPATAAGFLLGVAAHLFEIQEPTTGKPSDMVITLKRIVAQFSEGLSH